MAPKTIDIYSIAEKEAFKQTLYNALGWSPTPAHHNFNLVNYRYPDEEEVRKEIVRRVKEAGLHIRIGRIFAVFDYIHKDENDIKPRMRTYVDNAISILRFLLKDLPENISFVRSPGLEEDLDFVNLQSPPIYNRIMGEKLVREPESY